MAKYFHIKPTFGRWVGHPTTMYYIYGNHHRVAKINPVLFRQRKSWNLKQSQQSLSCIMSSSSSSSTAGSSNQMSMSKITPLRRKGSKDEILLRPKNKLDALHWSPQSATWYCETTSLTCHRMARGILPLLPSRRVTSSFRCLLPWMTGWLVAGVHVAVQKTNMSGEEILNL